MSSGPREAATSAPAGAVTSGADATAGVAKSGVDATASRWLGGLRQQLTLLMAGSMLVTLALLGVYMAREQSDLARRAIAGQAAAAARSIALGSENPLLTDRLDLVEELLLRSADFPGVRRASLVAPDGSAISTVERRPDGGMRTVFAGPGRHLAVPAGGHARVDPAVDGESLTAWHPIEAGRLLAWVRVEHGTASLREIRSGIWRGTLAACALALLGSLLLLHGLLHRPMRAVHRARDFAAELARADGRQLADDVGAREVRELVGAMNQASTTLQAQRQAIEEQLRMLRRQDAELAERSEQLAMVFALSPDGVVLFDDAGCVRFANPAFARLLDLLPEDIVGRDAAWLDAELAHRADEPQEQTLARIFDGASQGEPRRRSLSLRRPRHLELALVGVLGHAPTAVRLLYVRDVTHETEVDRLKSEFLSTAAHELRTPMVSIHGFTELLIHRPFDAPRRASMLETIHRHSSAMIHILNELLDLARIEARRGADFDIEPAELGRIVQQAVADFALPVGREAPRVEPSGWPLPVRVDHAKIAQVLRNLLSNAYKYSPGGGPVAVRLRRDGDAAIVEVADAGIGMTPEQLARVCERFYRADASGTILGTGLGMAIVKEIVELHRGHLGLTSQPGRGTTVTVTLPVHVPAATPTAPAELTAA